uniref:DUF1311 domain-containing protein n=1 Tax=Phenylobacterium glaciei TaxID=2803784 RepID=A0A974P103_9CAUL|nr:DUF1311 domain-containing protein [Phenylobacterium glaciei]
MRLICSNSDLAQADRHMAEAFAKAMERPDTRAEIRAAQRAWLRERDASPADADALMTLYSNRMVSLNQVPVQEPIY